MAKCTILYWQEIPSVVEAQEGRRRHKEQLSARFQELIDQVVMRKGLFGTDSYLEQWRRGPAVSREGTLEEVVRQVVAELEADYDTIERRAMAEAAEARRQANQGEGADSGA